MAIFSASAVVAAISGSIGGVTFVNAKASKVARIRPRRPIPKGPGIESAQSQMNQLQNAWGAFTDAERQSWRTAAASSETTNRLGQGSPPTGQQLFTSVNLEMHDSTVPFFELPAVVGRSEGPRDFTVSLSAAGDLTWNGQPPFGFGSAFFFVFARVFYTTVPPKGGKPMVFLGRFAAPSLARDMRTEIEAKWGPPLEGQVVICGMAASAGGLYRSRILTLIETVGA